MFNHSFYIFVTHPTCMYSRNFSFQGAGIRTSYRGGDKDKMNIIVVESLEMVLPPCSDVIFRAFQPPMKFFAELDVVPIVQKVQKLIPEGSYCPTEWTER